jgi:hypothetical protein
MQSVKKRVQNILAKIEAEYDFGQFTIESFHSWLEQQSGREIVFAPWSMPPGMFGIWLTGDDRDYIFYKADTSPVHQASIQLYEMAHILYERFIEKTNGAEAETFALLIQELAAGQELSII